MLGFHDIIQAYFVRLTGKFVMFSGRDMALLEDWRGQGASAASVCRGIRDAVRWMHNMDPPRDLYNCRTYIEPHIERARSRHISVEPSPMQRYEAGMRQSEALSRALQIIERAGPHCKRMGVQAIYRHAWYHIRGLGEGMDLDEQYRALLELEEALAEQFFEILEPAKQSALEQQIQHEARTLGLKMSEDGWRHHIAARRRFLLARDHGLISLLD